MVSPPDSTVGKAPAAPLRGTMNKKKTLAALTTMGQPKETLARRIRPAFRKHPRPHTKDRDRSVESIPVREFRDGQLVPRRPVERPVDRLVRTGYRIVRHLDAHGVVTCSMRQLQEYGFQDRLQPALFEDACQLGILGRVDVPERPHLVSSHRERHIRQELPDGSPNLVVRHFIICG